MAGERYACNDNQECRNTQGGFKCKKCSKSEKLVLDRHGRKKCKKRKCLTRPCVAEHGECIESTDRNGWSGRCLPGFTGETCDQDVDECQLDQFRNECPGDLSCVNTPGSFVCELDNQREVDTVQVRPEVNARPTEKATPGLGSNVRTLFRPAPITRGSKFCEARGQSVKVGEQCEFEAETCRERPCISGCRDVPGHCPCILDKYEFNVLQCTIIGSGVLLVFVMVWFLLICCIAKCIHRKSDQVQNKHNRHNHHHLTHDDFHLQSNLLM